MTAVRAGIEWLARMKWKWFLWGCQTPFLFRKKEMGFGKHAPVCLFKEKGASQRETPFGGWRETRFAGATKYKQKKRRAEKARPKIGLWDKDMSLLSSLERLLAPHAIG